MKVLNAIMAVALADANRDRAAEQSGCDERACLRPPRFHASVIATAL